MLGLVGLRRLRQRDTVQIALYGLADYTRGIESRAGHASHKTQEKWQVSE